MTDETAAPTTHNRPNGEGPAPPMPAMVPTRERDLWLTRRRALIQEVKAIEQYLGLDEKSQAGASNER